MSKVQLYDTTLRDGMQGGGMSLSAAEKLRVVRALDALGVGLIEAGFPGSNPKELELFELLASEPLEQATICAFGMTRRRGAGGRGRRGAERAGRLLRARRDPGRQDVGAAPRHGHEGLARGEPGDDRRLGRLLRRRRQARDLRRRALLRRLARRSRLRASSACGPRSTRGPRTSPLCDTNGSSLPHEIAEGDRARSSPSSVTGSASASTPTTTPSAASPTRSPGVRAGADLVQGTVNGFGERTGNANLISILPALQLKLGYECVAPERLRAAHRDRASDRRDLQPAAGRRASPTSAATPSPTRAACTSPASRPTRAPSSTWSRRRSATAARS